MDSPPPSVSQDIPFMDHLSIDFTLADPPYSQSSVSLGHSVGTSPLFSDQHSPYSEPPNPGPGRRPVPVSHLAVPSYGDRDKSPSSHVDIDIAYRTRRPSILSPALHHCNGHGETVSPWTPIALGPQPMIREDSQFLCPDRLRPIAPTDSGYDSAQSASRQQQHALMHRIAGDMSSHEDETPEAHAQQELHGQHSNAQNTATSHRGSVTKALSSSSRHSIADSESPEDFLCTDCSPEIRLNTQSEYTKHMARHVRRFKCLVLNCTQQKGFATQNDLDRHRKTVHKQVGVDDSVWKCFFPNCKSADKIWSRQDNFRQHIIRMHKVDPPDDVVRRSDEWLETVEKPRRRREQQELQTYASSYASRGLGDTLAPPCEPEPSITDTYDASHHDLDYLRPAMTYPTSFHEQDSWTPFMTEQLSGMARDYAEPNQYPMTMGIERSHNDAPAIHFSSANDPSMPAIMSHREDPAEFPFGVGFNHHESMPKSMPKSMPDLDRRNDWQERASTNLGMMSQDSMVPSYSQDFANMEGPNPTVDFLDDNMQTHGVTSSLDLAMDLSGARAADGDGKYFEKLTSHFLKNFADNAPLADKLHAAIRDVFHTHNASNTQGVAGSHITNSGESTPRSRIPAVTYKCNRDDCNASFPKRNALVKHEARHNQMFFCTDDACFSRFGAKIDLQRHERKHQHRQAWRCWSDGRARGKNKDCAQVFYDEARFDEHRKEHHSPGRANDLFRIEKDFVGSFWCGFCNKVVRNEASAGVDGSERINFRYNHIETETKQKFAKDANINPFAHWVSLGGNGKTKEETRAQLSAEVHENDENSDEDHPKNHLRPSPTTRLGGGRPRAVSASEPHGRHLNVPLSHRHQQQPPLRVLKRPSDFDSESRPLKTSRVQQSPLIDPRLRSPGASQGPTTPMQGSPTRHGPLHVKCCNCQHMPARLLNTTASKTCTSCQKPACGKCVYYQQDPLTGKTHRVGLATTAQR